MTVKREGRPVIPESDRLERIRAEKKTLSNELRELSAQVEKMPSASSVRERVTMLQLRLREVEERLEAAQLAEDMERESDA